MIIMAGFLDVRSDYESRYGFRDSVEAVVRAKPGLSKEVVEMISRTKSEPHWLLDFRLRSLEIFLKKPMPTWGADLSAIDFDKIVYYLKPADRQSHSWEEVPENIRNTFERLGIPEAERKFLAGAGAQYESENVYHKIREELAQQGVVFVSPDQALIPEKIDEWVEIGYTKSYAEKVQGIFRKHFGTVVPPEDNKFAALNSAVFSGGSFIYVPPGVKIEMPLQAYFRINSESFGQFERTLIVVDEDAQAHYIEGCSAPVYSRDSLHAAVVELVALPRSRLRYTTLQNWSNNVYNLVTKRSHAYEDAYVEWLDANIGSRITMKYPSVFMLGPRAKADILSVAYAGKGQHQDAGGKAVHLAPDTTSTIVSKSVSKDGGRTSYRGLLQVAKDATGVKSNVRCDALLLDEASRSDTYPYMQIEEKDATITHEATVGKIGEEQIFYLMSRGFTESEALAMIVLGFVQAFTKELPMEYAIEFNRLIQLEMAGAVG